MTDRAALTQAFLTQAFLSEAGLADARVEPLPADASTRSYARLHRDGRASLILMNAPPVEDSAPCGPGASKGERLAAGYNATARLAASRVDAFVAVSLYLRAVGLSAPEVLAFDVEAGLAVIEDLGTGLFARLIADGAAPVPYYEAAIDLLVHLHETPAPDLLPLPGGGWPLLTYDALALKTGADLFPAWQPSLAPSVRIDAEAMAQWDALWAPILARGEAGACVFAHRDYHAENLLWLPERSGLARVGLLDFQDAVRAHPAWDLLSLLQDARRDVGAEMEAAMLDRYLGARPKLDRQGFLFDYAGLAALNNARITGLFARLIIRDGKPRYRAFLPRMWGLLERNLAHPDLAGLRAWFDRYVLAEARA
jgi:aminoglycoside/choline kinase family phosphotransferase